MLDWKLLLVEVHSLDPVSTSFHLICQPSKLYASNSTPQLESLGYFVSASPTRAFASVLEMLHGTFRHG